MKKKGLTIKVTSRLLGRHQVGPLALAAALACQFGIGISRIEAGLSKTAPFEHRMKPFFLGGATIVDDTYNGTIEGLRAGLAFLKELSAKRKWYVTPGLVDQGRETKHVHKELGRLIAACAPDIVVLIQNSVTSYIQEGLRAGGFSGKLRVEPDPLRFYQGIEHVVAAGDVVLMQNDWTDYYV